jgi:hypothetical protein
MLGGGERLSQDTGVEALAARDGMRFDLSQLAPEAVQQLRGRYTPVRAECSYKVGV